MKVPWTVRMPSECSAMVIYGNPAWGLAGGDLVAAQRKDIFSSKVSLNMLTNIIRTVLMALAGLLMVPYYIDQFGIATYAILPLATTVTNYFVIIADSLSNAFSRYMTISAQTGDTNRMNVVFTSSVIGMGKCMLIMAPVAVLISLASPYVFQVEDSYADVQIMFLLIMATSMMISFGATLGGVYMAHNSLYVTYMSRSLQTVSQVGVVLFLLSSQGLGLTPSLPIIGASFAISGVLMLLAMVLMMKRVCPTIEFRRRLYDRDLLKEMGNLGIWAMIVELGSLLFIQASLVVANLMLGPETQGQFAIAANVIMLVHTACTALAAVSLPLIYREYATGDFNELIRVLKLFSKFVGITMTFPLAYAIVFLPEILGVWLGQDYPRLYDMLYIMLPVEVLICTTSVLSDIPVVFARVKPLATATLILGLTNVVSAELLIHFTDVGVIGVCVCWAASMILLKLIFYPFFCNKLTGGGLKAYFAPILEAYVVFLVCLAGLWGLSQLFVMPMNWAGIALPFVPLFLLFFILEMRFVFDKDEMRIIKTYLPRFVQRFISRLSDRA